MFFLCNYDKSLEIVQGITRAESDPAGRFRYSRSCGYVSRAALIEGEKILPDPCKECGTLAATHYCEPMRSRLVSKNLCFNCGFWDEKLEIKDDSRVFRIDGRHYQASGETSGPSRWRGFGGRSFRIQRLDNAEVIETSNLWHQGTIPDHFRARLPDNAIFL